MNKHGQLIRILFLYPQEMNTYGDWGNVLVIQKRLEWRGFRVRIIEHHPGDRLPSDVDLIFFGGGQDSGQSLIMDDLQMIGPQLNEWIEAEKAMLAICGGYQLLGREFVTQTDKRLPGLGILNFTTYAQADRLIGNVIIENQHFGQVIGFENHSGRTFLGQDLQPLGRVLQGAGNNGEDGGEGVIYKATIGTYLHGPILPKNPKVADWLIAKSIGITSKELVQLDDKYVARARSIAVASSY